MLSCTEASRVTGRLLDSGLSVEVAAKQSDVAIVGFKINIEDRAQNRDASYNGIKQYVSQHSGDQGLSSTATSGSPYDINRNDACGRISEYGHQTHQGVQSKTD